MKPDGNSCVWGLLPIHCSGMIRWVGSLQTTCPFLCHYICAEGLAVAACVLCPIWAQESWVQMLKHRHLCQTLVYVPKVHLLAEPSLCKASDLITANLISSEVRVPQMRLWSGKLSWVWSSLWKDPRDTLAGACRSDGCCCMGLAFLSSILPSKSDLFCVNGALWGNCYMAELNPVEKNKLWDKSDWNASSSWVLASQNIKILSTFWKMNSLKKAESGTYQTTRSPWKIRLCLFIWFRKQNCCEWWHRV